MFSSEQEKLIDRFNEQTIGLYHKWPEMIELIAPNNIHLENIFRTLYTKLAPNEPALPACWSYRLTTVSQRGDGIQGTSEPFWMPDAQEVRTWQLLVLDKLYVVTKESDYEPEDHLWVFTLRAPTSAALDVAVKELAQLLPPMPESKTPVEDDKLKEIVTHEKNEEAENSNQPYLFMSMLPGTESFLLSALEEHLAKLPGITNLKYDYLYNLAECYYEYDEIHFDFMNYHFAVYNDQDADKWDFYVQDNECPDNILSILSEYCKLFGKGT